MELDVARMHTDMSAMQSAIERLDSKLSTLQRVEVWADRALDLVSAGFVLALIACMFRI